MKYQPNRFRAKNRGFAALISVILISAILMLVATSLSFSGFYARYNVLDSELKEQSSDLAESCVNIARAKLARDANYSPSSEVISLPPDTCTIDSVTSSSTQKIIRAHAIYKDFRTNLRVNTRVSDLSIVSWEELP